MTDAEYAADLKRYIRLLQAELRKLEAGAPPPPSLDPISDHAVMRYTERVKKVDTRRLRAEILPPQAARPAQGGTWPDQVQRL